MRKMKLDLDALVVESFGAAAEGTKARGTVQGNDVEGLITVRLSCPATCGGSCDTGNPCAYC